MTDHATWQADVDEALQRGGPHGEQIYFSKDRRKHTHDYVPHAELVVVFRCGARHAKGRCGADFGWVWLTRCGPLIKCQRPVTKADQDEDDVLRSLVQDVKDYRAWVDKQAPENKGRPFRRPRTNVVISTDDLPEREGWHPTLMAGCPHRHPTVEIDRRTVLDAITEFRRDQSCVTRFVPDTG